VGLEAVPEGKWVCEDCEKGRHPCAACGVVSEDDVEGGVTKCRKGSCGLHYHESCLGMYNCRVDEGARERQEERQQAGDDSYVPPIFTCPAHFCWTCGDLDLRKPKKKKAAGCVPAGGKKVGLCLPVGGKKGKMAKKGEPVAEVRGGGGAAKQLEK
jgi:hypothetical protein